MMSAIIDKLFKAREKELISKFLEKIRHIPLFWVIDNEELREVYKWIDEIRDFYQKELGEKE